MASDDGESRTSEMYAVVKPEGPRHFYFSRDLVELITTDEIGKYRLTEDPKGDFWAWWEHERDMFIFCWPEEFLLEMCFVYGSKVREDQGVGKKFRVKVERVSE